MATPEYQNAEHKNSESNNKNRKSIRYAAKDYLSKHMQEIKIYTLVSIIYLAVALLMFPNITLNSTTTVLGNGGDIYQSLWDLWWVKYAIFNGMPLFYTKLLFWPIGSNLAYLTLTPLAGLVSIPFQAVSTAFAFNVLFFMSFALSGLTMFILVKYLTGNTYASFLSGFVFSFSTRHIAQSIAELPLMNIEWLPLAVYFFLKMVHSESNRSSYANAAALGITIIAIAFGSNIEYAVMILLALLTILVCYLVGKEKKELLKKQFLAAMAISIIVALVAGLWGIIPTVKALISGGSAINQENSVLSNELFSNPVMSFFIPSVFNGIFLNSIKGIASKLYVFGGIDSYSERAGFIGYIVIALSALAVYKNFKNSKVWVVLAVLFAWISLGPYIQLFNTPSSIPGIYLIIKHIPILNILREPGRFEFIAILALSVLTGYGFMELEKIKSLKILKDSKNNRLLLLSLACIIYLIGNNGFMYGNMLSLYTTKIHIPSPLYDIANVSGNFSVLYLPAFPLPGALPALYMGKATFYTSITHKPLVGGYLSRINTTQWNLLFNLPIALQAQDLLATPNLTSLNYPYPVNQNTTNQTIFTLYSYNTRFIIIDRSAYSPYMQSILYSYLEPVFGRPVITNSTIVFSIYKAIESHIFNSYVSYASVYSSNPNWYPTAIINVSGTPQTFWTPFYNNSYMGYITTYAPCSNMATCLITNQSISTKMSFSALLNYSTGELRVIVKNAQIQNEYDFNITSKLKNYNLTANFTSGEQANFVYFEFIPSQPNQVIEINNITFRRYR
ncbi:MAG: hypothetical protein ACP5RP_03350 [Candidatus Micrarchaeia archaeon]